MIDRSKGQPFNSINVLYFIHVSIECSCMKVIWIMHFEEACVIQFVNLNWYTETFWTCYIYIVLNIYKL